MKLGSALVAPALAASLLVAWAAPSRAAPGEGTELVLSLGAWVYVPTQDNGLRRL